MARKLALRRLMALLMALLCTALLVALLKLSEGRDRNGEKTVTVRQVGVALPPPPPPPQPPQQQSQASSSLDLSLADSANAVAIEFKQPSTEVRFDLPKPPSDTLASPNWNLDWEQDWQAFGLGELDQVPRLLTPIRVEFPRRLSQRGVRRSLAKLHVIIDERGRVMLKRINKLDHPELRPSLLKAVRQARFSPPGKGGQAVKAEFIWPLELEAG